MNNLHVFLFPFMAHGHMIPTLDIAKLFSSHGVRSSIITTPLNAPFFTKSIPKTGKQFSGTRIKILTIRFPTVEYGLPEGCENVDQVPTKDLIPRFIMASTMLKDQIEQLLVEHKPSCLVADTFFPWVTDVAAKFGIPRLVFHGTCLFSLSASEALRLYKPQNNVSSDDEPFVLPNLPHEIKLTRMHLAPQQRRVEDTESETGFNNFVEQVKESEFTSYGILVNSFFELEPDYAIHYRDVLGRRAWCIGPLSLCNGEMEDKAQRGKLAAIDGAECMKWLNSKSPNSVVYICFGSLGKFSVAQLYEIAMGLEATGQNFIWVVRKGGNVQEENEGWLPEGFEERTSKKGLIIRGWAPQVLILDHEAIGCFVTHCGWNSTLESVAAGVPLVTWPLFAEQFQNEKLVTEVLKIGVGVGALHWGNGAEGVGIRREEIAKAVETVMVGEEADKMRNRAKNLKDMARAAVEEGGSSYSDLNALIQELSSYKPSNSQVLNK